MRQQGWISVEVDEMDAALTNFPGLAPLANVGEWLGLFEDAETLMSLKEHARPGVCLLTPSGNRPSRTQRGPDTRRTPWPRCG